MGDKTVNTKGREARKNQQIRRARKALRHAEKRKAGEIRIARIKAHIAAVEAGKAPGPNFDRKNRREAARAAEEKAKEARRAGGRAPAPIVVQAADGKISEIQ